MWACLDGPATVPRLPVPVVCKGIGMSTQTVGSRHIDMQQQSQDAVSSVLPSCQAQQPAPGLTAGSWVKILVQAVLKTMPRATTRAMMAVSQAMAVLKATAALCGCPAPTSAPTRVLAAPANINSDQSPLVVRGWYASLLLSSRGKSRRWAGSRLMAGWWRPTCICCRPDLRQAWSHALRGYQSDLRCLHNE